MGVTLSQAGDRAGATRELRTTLDQRPNDTEAKMMLDSLGEVEAGRCVERAMAATFPRLKGMGAGEMGYSTSEVGDMVAAEVH